MPPTPTLPDRRMEAPSSDRRPPRIALVLGGGGLKGFAHVGALQALEARGIRPAVYAGTSIGALIAAAHAAGVSTGELAERATRLQRRDLFRINHVGMALQRMLSPSLYLEAPLRALVSSVVPRQRFRDLPAPVLVNTVDLERGTQLVWGLPGLDDAWVDDAVYASCALPGFFPPGMVEERPCIDGGTVDNLPVSFAGTLDVDAVVAVDVGSGQLPPARHIALRGFAAIFMRAATTMMGALQLGQLGRHQRPPLLLVRPDITQIDWFTFGRAEELIDCGRRAAEAALDHVDEWLGADEGIFPRRAVHVAVDQRRCVGCGICAALAPEVMALDARRCAYAHRPEVRWSPADGDFVRHCPTHAITAYDVHALDLAETAELPARRDRRPRVKPRL